MRKDPYAKERAELKQKLQGMSDPMQKFYALMLGNAKGEKGDTPVKGKDYFTPEERRSMINEVLEKIPVPKDADPVDYDLILTYVTQEVETLVRKEVSKLPKPQDGKPGKDAKVDIPSIVQALLKTMPKMESKEVDYLGIKEYIDKEVSKIKAEPRVVQSFTGGGATHLSQLIDVDVSSLTKNSNGQYILGGGGGVPDGGATGQVLGKLSNADGDADWITPAGGGDMLKSVYDPANKNSQLAAVSDLAAYVPYTGANADIIFANGAARAVSIAQSGAGVAGQDLALVAGDGGSGNTDGGDVYIGGGIKSGSGVGGDIVLAPGVGGVVKISDTSVANTATFITGSLSDDRQYTFPDKDGTFAMLSDITGGSGISRSINVTSGNLTVGAAAVTDYVVLVAGAHTITLPTAVSNTNLYTIKNNHSANITVNTTSSQTIDGTTTISLAPLESVQIISNNTNWFIV